MRRVVLLVLACCIGARATNYYVSSTSGSDSNNGTSAAMPWKTFSAAGNHINAGSFGAGDVIYLKRGDTWNEQLIPPSSGTSGSPIQFDAYGTGAAPVITAAAPIPFVSTSWMYVSGNVWKTKVPIVTGMGAATTVDMVQFGSVYGRRQPYGSGCTSAIVSKYDWCLVWPNLYVYSGNVSTPPTTTYAADGSITPYVDSTGGLPLIWVVDKIWLTFQHIKVQGFSYIGVGVTGASDNIVFANVESDGMLPYGTTPHGFYVNASAGHGTNIQFVNDDAHLNYDGFRISGAASVTLTNCRGYANRDAGLRDSTSGSVSPVTYSYSHFYGNNIAQFPTSDVVGNTAVPVAGSGNVSSAVAPVVTNFATYPARFSFTVDDVGSAAETEEYINSFLGTFSLRGLKFNVAVVPSYGVDWGSVNIWYASGNEIDSHSWSHQYYTTNLNPQASTPYPNSPSIDIQYTGSGTAATLTIASNFLSTTVTGASGDSIGPIDLTSSSYDTESKLLTYLVTKPSYAVVTDTSGPLVRPNTKTKNLAAVASHDIKTSSYALLYDQTKLLPDEMSSAKSAIEAKVPGLTETFYIYPDGIEDPTTESNAVTAGYPAGRGSLAMKGQDNSTGSANSLYSNGVNVQNITSLAAIQVHGMTQAQINQIAASLVFRAAAWGAPYGLFTHYNSRSDLTPDISNTELGWLLDAITANGGVWLTNTALANAITAGTGISGTTRYIQNPSGSAVNLAVAQASSPTVGRGATTGYPVDLNGVDRSKLGAWDIGATAYLAQRYGAAGATGSTRIGGWPTGQSVSLPQIWVNSNEWRGTTARTVTFPSSSTGGSWSCGASGYGPYTAGSQASLQQAINDAEACRTANGSGTTISIPAGTTFSGTAGLILPQTAGDTSTNFIVLQSSSPLPTGRTVCSHGIQDNVPASVQPGIRNNGCNASAMSYQLGKSIYSVSGAFTLANGTATDTSAYNDVASMYTVEFTSPGTAVQTAAADVNGVGPHHFALLNGEFRPLAGLNQGGSVIKIGSGQETGLRQIPSHIHVGYSYVHGDMLDAPMSGCPSACVATGPVTGANALPNAISLNGCLTCSLTYNYTDKNLRPSGEGHSWYCDLCQTIKVAHNWFEGASMGNLTAGVSDTLPIDQLDVQDLEDRANRYTYPYSWMLAADHPYYWNGIMSTTGGTGTGCTINLQGAGGGGTVNNVEVYAPGSGYAVNDVLNLIYGSHTNAQVTVTSVNGTGGVTGIGITNGGSSYQGNNYIRKNPYEYKACLRCLADGNIFENSDNSGGQSGQMIFLHTSNVSSGTGDNYWVKVTDITITNNILRNGCTGLSLGGRSGTTSGNGGGQTEPTQRYLYANNLLYNVSASNLRCTGVSDKYGLRTGGEVSGNTWPATASLDATGTIVTATLTGSAGKLQTRVHVGDPIQMSGCVSTSASSFNTTPTAMGPLTIAGTVTAGLTIVYPAPVAGIPNDTATGCTYNNIQGYLGNLTVSHNTHILDSAYDPKNDVNGGVTPYQMDRYLAWKNNITLGGTGLLATGWEGTRATNSTWDPVTLTYNNNVLADRDSAVTCPTHLSAGPGGAICYTEYGGPNAGASPPVTLYLTPTATCSGNDPTVGNCVGVVGAMSTGTLPLALPDWHQYRLCKTGDTACNGKASIYAAGGAYDASDGGDLGADLNQIEAAQTSTWYCNPSCGIGSFADVP